MSKFCVDSVFSQGGGGVSSLKSTINYFSEFSRVT